VQWGDDCAQRDSFYNLCNSPGNVPSLLPLNYKLKGQCLGQLNSSVWTQYNCTRMTVLSGDSVATAEPPGSKAVQMIYIDNCL
jgi:hypothetical protein